MILRGDVRTSESREALKDELRDPEYRYAYAEDFLNTWIATQIVAIREQRGLSQAQLGDLIGTKQPGVSRLEDVNHSTWKTDTLKKIARALGVRLKITFETFGTLLDEDAQFARRFVERPTFEDDPVFKEESSSELRVEAREAPNVISINIGRWSYAKTSHLEMAFLSSTSNIGWTDLHRIPPAQALAAQTDDIVGVPAATVAG